ncbi:hypothetical protein HZS_2681, partial [Henneguya salminicola]
MIGTIISLIFVYFEVVKCPLSCEKLIKIKDGKFQASCTQTGTAASQTFTAQWCAVTSETNCEALPTTSYTIGQSEVTTSTTGIPEQKFFLTFPFQLLKAGVYRISVKTDGSSELVETMEAIYQSSIKNQFGWTYSFTEKKPATFDCPLLYAPPKTINWFHKDNPITESDKYSFQSSLFIPKYTLSIKSIQFSDAGKYSCKYTFNNTTMAGHFYVGVRGVLAPLWPVIGILAEALIIAFIIYIMHKSDFK